MPSLFSHDCRKTDDCCEHGKTATAKLNGYIEDYANVADGLIVLYQVSGEVKYLVEAKRLAELMITEFWDADNGGFFFTSNDHEELIVRNKDFYDNATPSGNSVAADVLLRLAKLLGDEKYERFAVTVLRLDCIANTALSTRVWTSVVRDGISSEYDKRDCDYWRKGK